MLAEDGIRATGIDPTRALLAAARERDPGGTYLEGRAEDLPFADASFGLVVSYLTLIDIPDHRAAIAEMARVLAPGGTLLIANLAPWTTATARNWPETSGGWVETGGVKLFYAIDDYMAERSFWSAWKGIRIENHHRPLSSYMDALLGAGLTLCRYDEPPYHGPDPALAERYARIPWFVTMTWQKPA